MDTGYKRILFVYANVGTELRIPLALSILIAQVRKAGYEAKLFDSTFFGEFHTDNECMEKLGTHQGTNLNELVGRTENKDPKEELKKIVETWKPDLICTSLVERNVYTAKHLFSGLNTPVLVGGIMPTIAPEFFKTQDWVNHICVGEGEDFILDFLKGNKPRMSLTNMDDVPEQDWSDFDKRHLLKPFMGRVYRGGAFEFSRGCFKSCTFCVAPKIREVNKGLGCYHRTKTPERCIEEIRHKRDSYDLEMVAFGDTDFLGGVSKNRIRDFLQLYDKHIHLPFTMQASVRTLLDEEVLRELRKAQCCAISVGVESGSYKIQRQVLKKIIPLEVVKEAFNLCRKHDLRVTANYMIGLPYETEQDIQETIDFNRKVNPPSIAVTFFTPFIGTELYDVCIKEGFYKPFTENIYDYPPLSMPQISQNRIKEMCAEFTSDFAKYQDDFNIIGK